MLSLYAVYTALFGDMRTEGRTGGIKGGFGETGRWTERMTRQKAKLKI